MQALYSAFNEQAQHHFQEYGYVILAKVMSREQCDALRELTLRLAEWEQQQDCAAYYNDRRCQRVWNLLNKHAAFRETIQHPAVVDAIDRLFDEKYVLRSWTANIVSPGAEEGSLHIDTHVPDPVPPYLLEANTMWLLDDFTERNGATEIVPGSHLRWKHPDSRDQPAEHTMKVIAPKGSVILTHGALWHRSGNNETEQSRVVLLGSFAPEFVREIDIQEQYMVVLDKDVIEQASPLLRKMIGAGLGVKPGALQKPPAFL